MTNIFLAVVSSLPEGAEYDITLTVSWDAKVDKEILKRLLTIGTQIEFPGGSRPDPATQKSIALAIFDWYFENEGKLFTKVADRVVGVGSPNYTLRTGAGEAYAKWVVCCPPAKAIMDEELKLLSAGGDKTRQSGTETQCGIFLVCERLASFNLAGTSHMIVNLTQGDVIRVSNYDIESAFMAGIKRTPLPRGWHSTEELYKALDHAVARWIERNRGRKIGKSFNEGDDVALMFHVEWKL